MAVRRRTSRSTSPFEAEIKYAKETGYAFCWVRWWSEWLIGWNLEVLSREGMRRSESRNAMVMEQSIATLIPISGRKGREFTDWNPILGRGRERSRRSNKCTSK